MHDNPGAMPSAAAAARRPSCSAFPPAPLFTHAPVCSLPCLECLPPEERAQEEAIRLEGVAALDHGALREGASKAFTPDPMQW